METKLKNKESENKTSDIQKLHDEQLLKIIREFKDNVKRYTK